MLQSRKIMILMGLILLTCAKVNITYAKVSSNNIEKIKFGPQLGINILSGRAGIFGEYKFNEALGLQIDISYYRNLYILDGMEVTNGQTAVVQSGCISMPVTLRVYPGKDRQFCWFGGFQLGYIVSGKFSFSPKKLDTYSQEKIKDMLKDYVKNAYLDLKDINEQDRIRKFQLGMIAGFDYEFGFGLILGLSYCRELIDVIKSENSYINWNLQPSLGYNFGKLL